MPRENLSVAELDERAKLLREIKELEEWLEEHGCMFDDLKERVELLRDARELEEWNDKHDSAVNDDDLKERVDLLSSAKELEKWLDEESSIDVNDLQDKVNLLQELKAHDE